MSLETIKREIATWDDAALRKLISIILRLREERDPEWRLESARGIDTRPVDVGGTAEDSAR